MRRRATLLRSERSFLDRDCLTYLMQEPNLEMLVQWAMQDGSVVNTLTGGRLRDEAEKVIAKRKNLN